MLHFRNVPAGVGLLIHPMHRNVAPLRLAARALSTGCPFGRSIPERSTGNPLLAPRVRAPALRARWLSASTAIHAEAGPDKAMLFAKLRIHPTLKTNLKKMGLIEMTAVQAETLPPLLAGKGPCKLAAPHYLISTMP